MNGALKHILFATTDLDAVTALTTYLSADEVTVTNIASGMGAIQYIKQTGAADLLILEEHIKPLGAIQTIHYLKDNLNYTGEILIFSDADDTHIDTDDGSFQILKTGFEKADFDMVLQIISENKVDTKIDDKPYSLSYLSNLSDGDTDFICESLKIFNESVGMRIQEIENAFEAGAYKEVSNLAHNIKPSFEMLENKLGSIICDQLAHSEVDATKAKQIELLKTEYLKVQDSLKQDFPDLFEIA